MQEGTFNPNPCPVQVTAAQYVNEGSEGDCTLDESVSALIPSPIFLDALDASWSGEDFRYVNNDGTLVTWDPTARENGPPALLVELDAV